MATLAQVQSDFQALDTDDQREFLLMQRLPNPTQRAADNVWMLVLVILGIVVVGGGFLVFQLIVDDKDASVVVGFVSAALGAIIGLIAPSPLSGSN